MPGSPSPVRRTSLGRIAAALAAFLAAALLVLGPGANGARAHDALSGTTPAPDATVDAAPHQVTLEFGQPAQALGTQVLVSGPDGAPASRGAVDLVGTSVIQPLVPDLPPGTYTVQWRVSSADGHPISGTFTFTVAGGAAPAANAPEAAAGAAPEVTSVTPAPAPGGRSSPVIATAIAAILAAIGFQVVRQRRTRP